MSAELNRFQREIIEVVEFYVDDQNVARSNTIFKKSLDGKYIFNNPTKYLIDYLGVQGVRIKEDYFVKSTGNNEEVANVNEELIESL